MVNDGGGGREGAVTNRLNSNYLLTDLWRKA